MGYVIGVDEAGYGPNLGPLVVSATVWEVPGKPSQTPFWERFAGLITQTAPSAVDEIHVADSKQIHNPAKGVGALERGVLAAWGMLESIPTSLMDWWSRIALHPLNRNPLLRGPVNQSPPNESSLNQLTGGVPFELPTPPGTSIIELGENHAEPWFVDADLSLPQATGLDELTTLSELWSRRCVETGIRLVAIRSDIVLTRRFNDLTLQRNSKGLALSGITMRLLADVLPLTAGAPTMIWCDKHGGRNRYDELLQDILGDQFISRLEEGPERSRYRFGRNEICFQTQAEAHLPVALASMVCKYWRESTMELFNRYWCGRMPELKPTKGYPNDARRFKAEIAALQAQLGIAEVDLWRQR